MINKLLTNQYAVSVLKKGNTILFGLIATAFFSRAMGPAVKGEYDTYMNIVNILNVLLNLGISTIYPNYVRKREKWTESTFVVFSIFQFILYVAVSGLVWAISGNVIFAAVGLCIACSVFTFQLNNISLVENYLWNAVANGVSVLINAGLAVAVFAAGIKQVEIIMLCYCIKEFTVGAIALIFLRKDVRIGDVNAREILRMLRRGLIPMLTNLLIMVNYRIDVLFLNAYKVEYHQIGLYTSGLTVAEYAWIIPDIFKDVLINKTAKKDDLDSVKFCLRVSSSFLVIAYAVFLILGRVIIRVLFGVEFEEAFKVTDIVFIGVYGMVYCKLLGTLYLAQGRWNFYFFTLLGAVIINVITNNIFIPLIGIYGAALTTVVAYSFAGAVFLIDFKKRYKFRFTELIFIGKNDFKALRALVKRKKPQ